MVGDGAMVFDTGLLFANGRVLAGVGAEQRSAQSSGYAERSARVLSRGQTGLIAIETTEKRNFQV